MRSSLACLPARLSPASLKQLRALRSELFNVLLYCGDCMLEIVSPTDAGYEAAPGGLGGRGPNTQAKLLQKQGDSGYMAIFQVEDLVGVSRRLADQNVRDVSNNGMYTETAVGDGGAVHTMRYSTHDPAPLATGSGAHRARTTLAGVQWHPADCGTLLETDQAEPNLPGAVRISLPCPAKPQADSTSSFGPQAGCWMPAGNGWQNGLERKSTVCEEFAGVTIAVDEPAAMAKKYATGFDKPLVDGPGGPATAVQIDGRSDRRGAPPLVKFILPDPAWGGGRSGVVGVDLYAAAAGAGAASRTRNKKAFDDVRAAFASPVVPRLLAH